MSHKIRNVLRRLSAIAVALREPTALADIAKSQEVSERQILRDIKTLQQMGAPIVLRIKPYKWRLTRRWSFWKALERLATAE